MQELDRWCDQREEADRRVRRRVGRFVSPELPEAVEWLRVEVEVMAEEREEHTIQVLDETMERFLDHLEADVLHGDRYRAEALAAAAIAVVRYEMRAPYSGHDVKAWERARTLKSLVAWAREHSGGPS
jgi:hypothetical protein